MTNLPSWYRSYSSLSLSPLILYKWKSSPKLSLFPSISTANGSKTSRSCKIPRMHLSAWISLDLLLFQRKKDGNFIFLTPNFHYCNSIIQMLVFLSSLWSKSKNPISRLNSNWFLMKTLESFHLLPLLYNISRLTHQIFSTSEKKSVQLTYFHRSQLQTVVKPSGSSKIPWIHLSFSIHFSFLKSPFPRERAKISWFPF